jgi:hypothetical protein
MAVALTIPQVKDESKTVTRRKGWLRKGTPMLKEGDLLTLCAKVQGRKPGEPLDRIVTVTIVSVRRERLDAVTPEDVTAEGFPGWSPEQFIKFFCDTHKGCEPGTVITRIEWRYGSPLGEAPGTCDRETPGRAGSQRSEP